MRKTIFLVALLSGCTPYAEIGAGYNMEAGPYLFHEECAIGYVAAGLERGPWAIEAQHTSCLYDKPEIVTNQVILKRRFGGQ